MQKRVVTVLTVIMKLQVFSFHTYFLMISVGHDFMISANTTSHNFFNMTSLEVESPNEKLIAKGENYFEGSSHSFLFNDSPLDAKVLALVVIFLQYIQILWMIKLL